MHVIRQNKRKKTLVKNLLTNISCKIKYQPQATYAQPDITGGSEVLTVLLTYGPTLPKPIAQGCFLCLVISLTTDHLSCCPPTHLALSPFVDLCQ